MFVIQPTPETLNFFTVQMPFLYIDCIEAEEDGKSDSDQNQSRESMSDKDSLKYDWQNVLKRFSDRHPILYNRCLWTTTSSSAQSRQQSPVQLKGQRIILQRKIQKLTIHKTFLHKPHEKCIYTVKKDIRIESSLPSNGVKRR